MPFRDALNQIKRKVDEFQRQGTTYPGQGQNQNQNPYGYQQNQYQPPPQQYQQNQYQSYPNQNQQGQYQQQYPPGQYQSQNQYPPQNQFQQQQPFNNQPPPIPWQSKPNEASPPQVPVPGGSVYWQPRFDPSVAVGVDWDQKLGNSNGWGNNELEHYTNRSENSFHTPDGKLVLRAIAVNTSSDPAQKYTSARLVSRQRLSRPRGCLTGVLSSPCAEGIWPAFWLLPAEPFSWPTDGEIDIAETWNGDRNNKSCLHWGFYNAEDHQKHRTKGTQLDDMDRRPVRYDLVWDQPNDQPGQGRLIWYIDGRAVMKANIPPGTRKMSEWTVLLNVAMGGNVCAGKIPRDGHYDLVVHRLTMSDELEFGGWGRFEADWQTCPEGNC